MKNFNGLLNGLARLIWPCIPLMHKSAKWKYMEKQKIWNLRWGKLDTQVFFCLKYYHFFILSNYRIKKSFNLHCGGFAFLHRLQYFWFSIWCSCWNNSSKTNNWQHFNTVFTYIPFYNYKELFVIEYVLAVVKLFLMKWAKKTFKAVNWWKGKG